MRILGIALVLIGILMMAFNSINFQTEKKVLDVGPVEINKKENKHVGWPLYAGAVACITGAVVVLAARKRHQ